MHIYRERTWQSRMLTLLPAGESGWRLSEHSLYYSCNSSASSKLFQNYKLKKKNKPPPPPPIPVQFNWNFSVWEKISAKNLSDERLLLRKSLFENTHTQKKLQSPTTLGLNRLTHNNITCCWGWRKTRSLTRRRWELNIERSLWKTTWRWIWELNKHLP